MKHISPPAAASSIRSARRGVSLLEVMVVMTIMAAVMTVGVTGLTRLFRVQSREMQALSETTLWRRLARDFRTDVHNARQASSADDHTLELQTDAGAITWSVQNDVLQRRLEPAAEDTPAAVEQYRLPSATLTLSLTAPPDGQRPLAQVQATRSGDAHARPTTGHIEAAIGLTHRFQQRVAAGGTP